MAKGFLGKLFGQNADDDKPRYRMSYMDFVRLSGLPESKFAFQTNGEFPLLSYTIDNLQVEASAQVEITKDGTRVTIRNEHMGTHPDAAYLSVTTVALFITRAQPLVTPEGENIVVLKPKTTSVHGHQNVIVENIYKNGLFGRRAAQSVTKESVENILGALRRDLELSQKFGGPVYKAHTPF